MVMPRFSPNLSLITHIKQPLRKWVEAVMYGAKLTWQTDLAGDHSDRNAARAWNGPLRESVEGLAEKDRRLRIVVVTFAGLVPASPVQSDGDLKIVFAVEVDPTKGKASGIGLHGIE